MICLYLAKSSSITLPDDSKVRPLTHETCTDKRLENFRDCRGASMDPVYTGRFAADSNGEVKFGFENEKNGQHVKFSGITVRACDLAPKLGKKFEIFLLE